MLFEIVNIYYRFFFKFFFLKFSWNRWVLHKHSQICILKRKWKSIYVSNLKKHNPFWKICQNNRPSQSSKGSEPLKKSNLHSMGHENEKASFVLQLNFLSDPKNSCHCTFFLCQDHVLCKLRTNVEKCLAYFRVSSNYAVF